jgi:hypothetical protein
MTPHSLNVVTNVSEEPAGSILGVLRKLKIGSYDEKETVLFPYISGEIYENL